NRILASVPFTASPTGAVGLAVKGTDARMRFATASCSWGVPSWSGATIIGDRGFFSNERVGLTAYGPYFAVAATGNDGKPYFLMQQPSGGTTVWPSSFEPAGYDAKRSTAS